MSKELTKKIQDNKIAIITLANHGFLNFTMNCIKSLEKIGLEGVMKVYCIDDKCYDELSSSYQNCCLIESEYNKKVSKLQIYPRANWRRKTAYKDIMLMKYPAILDALENNDYVLFLDADVVFHDARFIDYLLENIKDNDVLFQSETSDGTTDKDAPCAGLMFIRSNKKTLDFYDPTNVVNDKHYINNVGDQDYVRGNVDNLKYDYMDVKLFSNGRYFQNFKSKLSPYMVHYNWCRPKQKIKIMKRTNGWFI